MTDVALIEVSIKDYEGIVPINYLEHDKIHIVQDPADLIGKCRWALKEKRRGNLRHGIIYIYTFIHHEGRYKENRTDRQRTEFTI